MNRAFSIVFVLGVLLAGAYCAPQGFRMGACALSARCHQSGPVCVIDENGDLKSFENKCMADVDSCRYGTYYVEVKEGVC